MTKERARGRERVAVRVEGTRACRARLSLALLKGIPRARLLEILRRSGTPESLFLPEEGEAAPSGLSPVEASLLARDVSGEVDEQLRLGIPAECGITAWTDEQYPSLLRHIHYPPLVLFWRGNISCAERPTIAVVGSRKCSHSGRAVAERLGRSLAARGFVVVSGMARGIDTAAHRGALAAGGESIAVLGCGVDVCYPAENRRLLADIVEKGAVVSEFLMGTPPLKQNFPLRNRIVSGLSLGVLVIEAGEASGALVTVAHALSQGREVFVVPGDTTITSTIGSNRLLKEGARPVTEVEDIIEELGPRLEGKLEPIGSCAPMADSLSGKEEILLACLSHAPAHVDLICAQAGFEPSEALSLLVTLELKGYVRQEPGNLFLKAANIQ